MLWYLRDKYDKYWITSADCNISNRILSLLTLRASSGLWRTLKDSLNSWEESLSGQLWVATILFSRSTIFLNGKTNILFCKKVNSFPIVKITSQNKFIYHNIDVAGRSPWWRGRKERAGHPHYCWSQFLAGFIFPVQWGGISQMMAGSGSNSHVVDLRGAWIGSAKRGLVTKL